MSRICQEVDENAWMEFYHSGGNRNDTRKNVKRWKFRNLPVRLHNNHVSSDGYIEVEIGHQFEWKKLGTSQMTPKRKTWRSIWNYFKETLRRTHAAAVDADTTKRTNKTSSSKCQTRRKMMFAAEITCIKYTKESNVPVVTSRYT